LEANPEGKNLAPWTEKPEYRSGKKRATFTGDAKKKKGPAWDPNPVGGERWASSKVVNRGGLNSVRGDGERAIGCT